MAVAGQDNWLWQQEPPPRGKSGLGILGQRSAFGHEQNNTCLYVVISDDSSRSVNKKKHTKASVNLVLVFAHSNIPRNPEKALGGVMSVSESDERAWILIVTMHVIVTIFMAVIISHHMQQDPEFSNRTARLRQCNHDTLNVITAI